ncbi:hypothetical protein BDY21DRAFT_338439 [Lineolata rhizophorae]|uniref:Uncharacterized protein n=1 Tax=Lineolata rhizophorae TaxID=578093 RepID=A0A6A6P6P1_9PEZI|nr:hypothetical protein BDY21DRAFT_338439 [Lineolata rhizophorae]
MREFFKGETSCIRLYCRDCSFPANVIWYHARKGQCPTLPPAPRSWFPIASYMSTYI